MTDDMLNPLSIISENLMTLSSTASEKSGERNEQKKKIGHISRPEVIF